jgi:Raf kinase inhibitor-like YbhB/YbcL family protein
MRLFSNLFTSFLSLGLARGWAPGLALAFLALVVSTLGAVAWLGLAEVHAAKHNFAVMTPGVERVWPMAQVFNGFGCTGQNTSPAVQWTPGPTGTKSYAVTIYDPDAPTGSGWWHWTVVNIPPTVYQLSSGGPLPVGAVQGRNDFGTANFGGACPPVGDKPHRYVVTVWALKVAKLDGIGAEASGALVGYMLNSQQLAKASVTRYYRR